MSLQNLDSKTWNIVSINGALHTRSNVARLYLPRKEEGRRLTSVTECVETETRSLHGYLVESQEWMLNAALEEKVIVGMTESVEEYNIRFYELKLRDWKHKPLHGAFVKDIEGIAVEESWR